MAVAVKAPPAKASIVKNGKAATSSSDEDSDTDDSSDDEKVRVQYKNTMTLVQQHFLLLCMSV